MFRLQCRGCGEWVRIDESQAGTMADCPECGHPIDVPSLPLPEIGRGPIPEMQTPSPAVPGARPAPRKDERQSHPSPQPARGLPVPVAPQPSTPTTAIQVNLPTTTVSSSMGIASVVLGVMAFVTCWVIVAGLLFSVVGLGLGVAGLLVAAQRKWEGIGYAIAGTTINAVALLGSIVFTALVARGIWGESKPAAQETVVQQPEPTEVSTIDTQGGKWAVAGTPLELDGLRISIRTVSVCRVEVYDRMTRRSPLMDTPDILVWLDVQNASDNQKLDYCGWMGEDALISGVSATLTDEHGNDYRRIDYGPFSSIIGATTEESLYPGKIIHDAVAFEVPVDKAKKLRLRLKNPIRGRTGEFRFLIPRRMIRETK